MIEREDVLSVAESLNITLTEEQITEVLDSFLAECKADPTGEWYLIVEHIIDNITR